MQTKRVTGVFRKPKQLNIIEEYASLSPQRKFALCDHYFMKGSQSFENAVKLLWPRAKQRDVKKLGNFLILLKSAHH